MFKRISILQPITENAVETAVREKQASGSQQPGVRQPVARSQADQSDAFVMKEIIRECPDFCVNKITGHSNIRSEEQEHPGPPGQFNVDLSDAPDAQGKHGYFFEKQKKFH